MKKIIITILTLITITTTIFFACKKSYKDDERFVPINNEYSDFAINFDELTKKTGIDIYKLSKLSSIEKFSQDFNKIGTSNSKVEINDALYEQIRQLRIAIEAAAANEDYVTFLALSEQLFTITKSITGIKFVTNQNGYIVIEYNDSEYHISDVSEHIAEAKELFRGASNEFPEFPDLPYETQQELLTAALYLKYLTDEGIEDPLLQPRTCASVKAELVIRLTGYTLAYTATAGLCCGSTYAVIVCEGLAFAAYIDSTTSAINSYNKDMKTCTN